MSREDVIREICDRYQQIGHALNERQRRLWAAREALTLGRGGIAVISKVLRISPNTIVKGMQEIATGQADSSSGADTRIRRPGGGRKRKES